MDAVFSHLDRCITGLGQQRLYSRLREPSLAEGAVAAFDTRVRAFGEDATLRGRFRRALRPLTSHATLDLARILHGDVPPLPRAAQLFPFMSLATALAGVVAFLWPIALLLFVGLVIGNIAVRIRLNDAMAVHAQALAALMPLVSAARGIVQLGAGALTP